jgi:pentapeptide MXKDX repeat protein
MMKSSRQLKLVMIGVALLSSGCKFTELSQPKALKHGKLVGERSQDPLKKQVLIHYANNPVNTETYLRERESILKNFDGAAAILPARKKIVEGAKGRVAEDLNKFNDALAIDIADIKLSICRSNVPIKAGVLFINNSSLVNRRIEVCHPGESPTLVPQKIADQVFHVYDQIKGNQIYQHSPLAHVDVLRASLKIAAEIFPAHMHEYSLVIKSHGNEELTITPKVAFESRLVTSKFLANFFANRPETRSVAQLDKDGLDKDGLDKDGLDKDGLDKDGLDKDGLDKDGLDKDGLDNQDPITAQNIRAAGISKEQMLRVVMEPSHKMYFNILFLESCNSDLGVLMHDLAETETPNIGYLFTSDERGLSYNTVDYLRARKSVSGSLRAWLATELNMAAEMAK